MEYTCLSCMAYVLRELGDWERAAELCQELRHPDASPAQTVVADGVLGMIRGFQGDLRIARPLLAKSLETARRLNVVSMTVDCCCRAGVAGRAGGRLRRRARALRSFLLDRWQRSEDHHYAVWGLRWAACFFARHGRSGRGPRVRGRIVEHRHDRLATPTRSRRWPTRWARPRWPTARPTAAVEQMTRAVGLHEQLEIPFERAQVQLRTGVGAGRRG